jgi:hypothetical protein
LFDTQQDKYVLLDQKTSESINRSLNGSDLNAEEQRIVSKLLEAGILDNRKGRPFEEAEEKKGCGDYAWVYRPFDDELYGMKRAKLKYVLLIVFVQLFLRVLGIVQVLSIGDQTRRIVRRFLSRQRSVSEFLRQVDEIVVSSRWAPFRFECLEFALCVRTYADLLGISTNFLLGVQRLPFIAHAWVELERGGVPIGDVADIRERLNIIYERRSICSAKAKCEYLLEI